MKEFKCSICQGLLQVDPGNDPTRDMTYDGAINNFTIGYGSKFDGEMWTLAICDECLEKMTPIAVKEYI